jgi:hypothetical protein
MKNIIKFGLFSFLLLSEFTTFAQVGDEDNNGGTGLEGKDPAPAPVDGKLIILLVLGLLFAVYKFKSLQRKA